MSPLQVRKQQDKKTHKTTHRSLFTNLKYTEWPASGEGLGRLGLGSGFGAHIQCSRGAQLSANKGINLFERAGFIIL